MKDRTADSTPYYKLTLTKDRPTKHKSRFDAFVLDCGLFAYQSESDFKRTMKEDGRNIYVKEQYFLL